MEQRPLYKTLWNQLSKDKSMILLAGPRQSGKTTFAREIVARDYPDTVYFNQDQLADKQKIMTDPLFFTHAPRASLSSRPLVILDEIHKYRHWKNYLKGVYDQFSREYQFLVTGSGRLEFSRETGDSLAGRYLKFHIFPLTLAELSSGRRTWDAFIKNPLEDFDDTSPAKTAEAFEALWTLSGFPEPFFNGRQTFWRTWTPSYGQQIVRDDLKTIADIRNMDTLDLLFSLLPGRVGSPVSINNLAGDLQVSFDTVKNWLLLFDLFYLSFRLSPWSAKITRGLRKEKKIYIFNYPLIEDEGHRFEALMAVDLLRAAETWTAHGWGDFRLHYIRNKEKQEVDFLLTNNSHPILLAEAKVSGDAPSASLKAFQNVLNIPAVQLVKKNGVRNIFRNGQNNILVVTAHRWLSSLP